MQVYDSSSGVGIRPSWGITLHAFRRSLPPIRLWSSSADFGIFNDPPKTFSQTSHFPRYIEWVLRTRPSRIEYTKKLSCGETVEFDDSAGWRGLRIQSTQCWRRRHSHALETTALRTLALFLGTPLIAPDPPPRHMPSPLEPSRTLNHLLLRVFIYCPYYDCRDCRPDHFNGS